MRSVKDVVRAAGLAAALVSVAGVASAEQVLECDFEQKSANGNWLAPKVIVVHEKGMDDAFVLDGLIQAFHDTPLAAKVAVDNEKRITFSWTLKATKSGSNQYANMGYRLTLIKGSKKASLTGEPFGYANTFRAAGSCKEIQGKQKS